VWWWSRLSRLHLLLLLGVMGLHLLGLLLVTLLHLLLLGFVGLLFRSLLMFFFLLLGQLLVLLLLLLVELLLLLLILLVGLGITSRYWSGLLVWRKVLGMNWSLGRGVLWARARLVASGLSPIRWRMIWSTRLLSGHDVAALKRSRAVGGCYGRFALVGGCP
jgi:hypothetical protein